MLSTARHENSPRPCAIKISGRKPGTNAGHPGRHEKARAELTGAGGSHTSSTFGVRHCCLANIDLAPRFVRDSHAMSWTAGDDTGRLYGPRADPRGHGSAVDCGPRQACFPTFHHDATLADWATAPAWWARYARTQVSRESRSSPLAKGL